MYISEWDLDSVVSVGLLENTKSLYDYLIISALIFHLSYSPFLAASPNISQIQGEFSGQNPWELW